MYVFMYVLIEHRRVSRRLWCVFDYPTEAAGRSLQSLPPEVQTAVEDGIITPTLLKR